MIMKRERKTDKEIHDDPVKSQKSPLALTKPYPLGQRENMLNPKKPFLPRRCEKFEFKS
jgi:hypothetical protein